ncbi:unnamed protein product [Adineta ricciae]|uniref:Uncharacterized protein n=1 Tax=Adineta ricciae TaxID=249248 RepID=A0A815L6F9_ADIRI|nr:unnamed protein product [Adineta ricciae]
MNTSQSMSIGLLLVVLLITTAQITTGQTEVNSSTAAPTVQTSMVTNYTTISPNTTTSTMNTTTSTTTKLTTTTSKPSGRKFDGLSFVGGMILATGLSALIYLVVSYLRRNNQLPYSNLH